MNQIWKNCEEMMDQLAKEKQERIEKIIEEVSQEKYEKIAEIKGSFDFMIKKLEQLKQKEKAEAKRKEKDEEVKQMQAQMDQLKKERIEELNKEFDEKKKQLMIGQKDRQIQEASSKLAMQNVSLMKTPRGRKGNSQIFGLLSN